MRQSSSRSLLGQILVAIATCASPCRDRWISIEGGDEAVLRVHPALSAVVALVGRKPDFR
jgi:hypothetical protein